MLKSSTFRSYDYLILQTDRRDDHLQPFQVWKQDMLHSRYVLSTLHYGCNQSVHNIFQCREGGLENKLRSLHRDFNVNYLKINDERYRVEWATTTNKQSTCTYILPSIVSFMFIWRVTSYQVLHLYVTT